MFNVLVLYGGRSGEHDVSLLSAASVLRNLPRDYSVSLVGIDKTGVWYVQPPALVGGWKSGTGPLELIRDDANICAVLPGKGISARGLPVAADVVFPVLHGTFGEDGTLQGLLELLDLPYVGSGVLGSALAMDKAVAKNLFRAAGLPILPFASIHRTDSVQPVIDRLGLPVFVKPARSGSSVGTNRVDSAVDLPAALSDAFRYDTKVVVEKAVRAREIECSVIGNRNPEAFTPGEVVPNHVFYDYEAKYLDPNGAALLVPAPISETDVRRIKDIAREAYTALSIEGMARVDFFIDKADGAIYLNEINTIPGFTHISMFPRMCEADGLSYQRLLERLIRLAIERQEERRGLDYSFTSVRKHSHVTAVDVPADGVPRPKPPPPIATQPASGEEPL